MIARLLLGFFLLIATVARADIGDIATINQLKREAEAAFQSKFWNVAISKYKLLTEKYQVQEPAVLLNLAHAYFQAKELSMALTSYEQAAKSNDKAVQTIAYQQAAIIKAQSGQLEEALKYLRSSLRASPGNQAARYNYEVVYALLTRQKQQQQGQNEQDNSDQSQQNQNRQQQQQNAEKQKQQQKGQQGKDNPQTGEQDEQSSEKGKMEDKGSDSKLRSRRLEQIKMSEDQAKTMLDAIRNNEVQYLQQMQRQPGRRTDRSKPDW